MPASIEGRMPTIPEYYKDFIDQSVDLALEPKQCCPFHKEDTPSFSYSREKKVWRCFGACKCGGDVIALHQKNYHLHSREDAKRSLVSLYHIYVPKESFVQRKSEVAVDQNRVEMEVKLNALILKANTVERWLELDYVMSRYPVELQDLQDLLSSWG